MQALRVRALRRLPIAFGWMAKRPLPDELLDRWLEPLQTPARRCGATLRKYVTGGAAPADGRGAASGCARSTRPALVVWTPEDKVQRARARPALRRAAARRAPGRDRRQLHADHARPAAGVRARDPRVRARDGRRAPRAERLPTPAGAAARARARMARDGPTSSSAC